MPLTRKQLNGLRHCPDSRVKQAVESALAYAQRAEYAEKQVRDLQEKLAAKEQDYRILALMHRDGAVELWSEQWMPVRFAYVPDLGKGREDEAEDWAMSHLPQPYRNLYDSSESQRIGRGTSRSCLSRGEFNDVQAKLLVIRALREVEAGGNKP